MHDSPRGFHGRNSNSNGNHALRKLDYFHNEPFPAVATCREDPKIPYTVWQDTPATADHIATHRPFDAAYNANNTIVTRADGSKYFLTSTITPVGCSSNFSKRYCDH